MPVRGRTVREFTAGADFWNILDGWAQQTGYRLIAFDQSSRLYQRGVGFLVAPQRLQATYTGAGYRLEAFVWVPLFTRVFTLMLMPEELRIDPGGFTGTLPRSTARGHVNLLLQALGQPPIA
ncbi:MAG: hypothetical protein C4536_08835 [Actinobacteria bacterium]|jgi:hypothetical protein|nr:MAG: hypothetical protein C4536_08835 [Actinomycetota bacterium]